MGATSYVMIFKLYCFYYTQSVLKVIFYSFVILNSVHSSIKSYGKIRLDKLLGHPVFRALGGTTEG